MFIRAIVRTPGKSIVNGLSNANLGIPDYELALQQHRAYIQALDSCGLEVLVLESNEDYPDSTFIEDVAVLTPDCAVITNPGAPSRKGEINGLREVLRQFYSKFEQIQAPGTLEGGDIMMVNSHYYIGLSNRTNLEGAQQLISILVKYGMSASLLELKDMLHLKTGLAYLENNNLLAAGEFINHPLFQKYHILPIDMNESYAANCIWVNDRVLVPAGYSIAKEMIEKAGYATIEVDVSEFRKLDGGLSCLSLRF